MKLLHTGAVASAIALLLPVTSSAAESSPRKRLNDGFSLVQRAILNVKKPGYLSFVQDPVSKTNHLLVSSFQAFGKDHVYSITEWNKGLTNPNALDFAILNNQITWPNETRMARTETFGTDGVVVAGGFLVPGKATGAVTFVPWHSPENPRTLTQPKKGWYYHRTEEWDVNGDGQMDIITARGTIPVIGKPDGELLWLENPGTSDTTSTWKEHLIARGPDVHFRILNNPEMRWSNNHPLTIITTEFSARKLTAFRQNETGGFDSFLLDDTLGAGFDIQIEDLNADGNPDLLVTNHEPDLKASVFAYEFDPQSLRIVRRHTLLTGIETRQKGIKQASPGTIHAFHPSMRRTQSINKPWILVSGDGSQRAHLLVPNRKADSNDWTYSEHIVWDAQSTVGQSAVGDLDGDGQVELMIPAYDANKVAIFTLTEKN